MVNILCTNSFRSLIAAWLEPVYCSTINLLWSLMSKSTTFRSISYGPCSRTGVTCVASDLFPYVAGLSEQLGRIYKLRNIHMYHKPACDIDSSHTYIGETRRPLSQRFKEHTNLDKPTGVGDHCRATGHSVSTKNTTILTRESNWHKRKVKEAIYIRQRAPTMNIDQGYHLPAIYNQSIPLKSEATYVTPVREQGP